MHLQQSPQPTDYGGYLARLVVLLATFGAGFLLQHVSSGRPVFGLVILIGVLLVCVGLIAGPRTGLTGTRIVVPLFDLAWIMFAMYLTNGLNSFLLPLLYIVVATASMRGDRWEIGTSLAGSLTGIFILATIHHDQADWPFAAAQAALLAAGALAVRLTAGVQFRRVAQASRELYKDLLATTSDAVFTLDADEWMICEANPAAVALFADPMKQLKEQPLASVIHFVDTAFLKTCREKLSHNEPVRDALTYATSRDDKRLTLRFNLSPFWQQDDAHLVQAVIEVTEDVEALPKTRPTPSDDDFSLNYIPSLTHELNNHLAAIRLSAELAEATGHTPDFKTMQQQVDHCQEVLQTVVLQMLRSATPVHSTEGIPTAELSQAVERALLLTRPQVLTAGVNLRVSIPADLPQVACFTHELQEALIRMIIHSVKLLSTAEQPRNLSLSAKVKGEHVEVLMIDDGPGWGARELSVLNGRSVVPCRAEDRGWDIVRDAICRFGGKVQASNGLNGGIRFRMTLPLTAEQE